MKKIKNLAIGGIQAKVICLILFTVLLLSGAYLVVSLSQSTLMSRVASESSRRQRESIGEITGETLKDIVEQDLERFNRTDAAIADAVFRSAAQRVTFLADCATKLLAHPEDYAPKPWGDPDPANDGAWTAKAIYAEGVDRDDPALTAKLGLLGNLSETMRSLCPSLGAPSLYLGLPEGVHLSVSDNDSEWFTDGILRPFDPSQRAWYQKAAGEGGLVFTDGERDARTGEYCIECAMPVYGPDGTLQAVVGTDLFIDQLDRVMQEHNVEGEYDLLVDENGTPVLKPQAELFPMNPAEREIDLRQSHDALLAEVVTVALSERESAVALGKLDGSGYYLTASPIHSTGWVLVSAFSEAEATKAVTVLQWTNEIIQEEASEAYHARLTQSWLRAAALLFVVMLVTLGAAIRHGKHIVGPLKTMTRQVSELDVDGGDLEFSMKDAYRTGDEVEALAESFTALSHKTMEYMDRVVKTTAEKERIDTELNLAEKIQVDMLPHTFPPFPDRREFDLYASMDPAKEVGGDFYDYFLVDDDHLCLLIADVSGKGIPAALFMMSSMILLRSTAMTGLSPAQILSRANEAVCANNEMGMFVTVWLGILELSTGRLVAANAGHEYPALKAPGQPFELYTDPHGFVVGGMEGLRYREYELTLEPGAKLFVYTDGVPEATDAQKALFDTGRMVDALNIRPDAGPEQLLKNVRDAVDGFVKDAEQFDDLTMLCLEYKGIDGKGGKET